LRQQTIRSTDLQKTLSWAGPFLGFVPAPRYATQTPAEAAAAEIQRGSAESLTHDQAAHSRAVAELVRDIRTGKVSNDERFKQRAGEIGVRDQAEVRRIEQRVSMSPFEYHVSKMPLWHCAMNRLSRRPAP